MTGAALHGVAGTRGVVLIFVYHAPVAQLDRASGYEPTKRKL